MKKNAPRGVHFFCVWSKLVCLSCEEGIEASFALAKLGSGLKELAGEEIFSPRRAILIFIDLTKKRVGANIQIKEMPGSVGRLHILAIKPPHVVRQGGFTFYSSLSFR